MIIFIPEEISPDSYYRESGNEFPTLSQHSHSHSDEADLQSLTENVDYPIGEEIFREVSFFTGRGASVRDR